jgi:MoxR-like ATPase
MHDPTTESTVGRAGPSGSAVRPGPGGAGGGGGDDGAGAGDPVLGVADVAPLAARVLDEVERAVVGKRATLELVLFALLADGHVLIEDVPGVAKTLMARSFARVTDLGFARVQFTPDLMPSEVTGSSVFDPRTAQVDFRPGPVFTNLLLADEINRAPTKTQAALLESMEERQVTIDGTSHRLPRPFLVVATQNPIEYEGTYPLPEAQLDRFLLRAAVGYPERDDELDLVHRRLDRRRDEPDLAQVADVATLRALQRAVEDVHIDDSVRSYLVDVVRATRSSPRTEVGASPRGTLALLKLTRARAAVHGRAFVLPDDVKALAGPALAHRLVLRPELWVQGVQADSVVADCLADVPAPPAEDVVAAAAAAAAPGAGA